MPLAQDQLKTLLAIASEAALKGGAVLDTYFGKLTSIQEKGRVGDLVTNADRASEAEVLALLRDRCPDHGILAEESGNVAAQDSEFLWVIDPLDGTTNYAHQYPFFAVSIGLLYQGQPVVGAIYAPYFKELFEAAQGLGATVNQRPIQVSGTAELSKSLLVTGFAYDRRETKDNNYAEFCHFTHLTQGVRRGGSAALDLAYVACGRLDGYWERGLSAWDMAAGIILVQEAGGRVSAYDGGTFQLDSGRVLATNQRLHAAMSEELLKVRAAIAGQTKYFLPIPA
ncbi:MAG: inositol monophosphatase family protein [Cyanobacteria bacterium P01_H01_bin.121]